MPIKVSIMSSKGGSLLRLYHFDLNSNGEIWGRPRADLIFMVGWFVCPTILTVTNSKAAGLEKTLI